MKPFKFFQRLKRTIPIPGTNNLRRYVGVNPGVINAMSLPVGRVFYMEVDNLIEREGEIPEVSMQLNSSSVTANVVNIQSLNSFKEENINNYIWIYQWKLPEDLEYTLFTSDEDPDIPQDVPLVLRCVIRVNI